MYTAEQSNLTTCDTSAFTHLFQSHQTISIETGSALIHGLSTQAGILLEGAATRWVRRSMVRQAQPLVLRLQVKTVVLYRQLFLRTRSAGAEQGCSCPLLRLYFL
eukprot:472492-Hanusia_phi.AAC.4